MSAIAIDFIDFNSENSTPAFYYQENREQNWLDKNNIRDQLKIDLQSLPHTWREQNNANSLGVESDVTFEKRCNDRLILLARAYGKNQVSENQREVLARIEMIESEIDSKVPRYDEEDWKLLEDFKVSLAKLAEGS